MCQSLLEIDSVVDGLFHENHAGSRVGEVAGFDEDERWAIRQAYGCVAALFEAA
jgi:hypothetical protein